MPCYNPLAATRLPAGTLVIHTRKPGEARKKTPEGYGKDLAIPCGRCIGCRAETQRQWATRCQHEAQLHERNCALTLTYSNDANYREAFASQDWLRPHQDVWTSQKSAREFSTIAQDGLQGPNNAHVDNSRSNYKERIELSKGDHTKFIKKMRSRINQPMSFYMCGEYGERLSRPHYHYLIFGYDFPDKKYFKTSLSGTKLFRSEELEEIWTEGHAWIGELDVATCNYVAGYVMKKISGEKAETHYLRTDEAGNDFWIQPEFSLMSRNPAIGKKWWERFHQDVSSADGVWHHATKTKPPRYYDKLLERVNPGLHDRIKKQRLEKAEDKDNSPARLYAKEIVHVARINLKKRNYEK